jgi:tetratricopeptide (TPR) repeat protein
MANSSSSSLPPLNPEHRRVAISQFEHSNQAVATGNYDYAVRLLMSCCKLDPGNLIYRQTLRRTEKAKYKNNLRGAVLSWLTTWPGKARVKTALKTGDYLGVLEHGERVLARNPWDVGAQMDMAEAADALGQLDLAVWLLEQARQKTQTSAALNRALARLYEKRGNFSQAIALWNLVRKVRPSDQEADRKLKDLAVSDTIARGNYEGAVAEAAAVTNPAGGEAPETDHTKSKGKEYRVPVSAAQAEGTDAPTDRAGREAAPIRARLQADLTNAGLYLQLAAVYRRNGALDQARTALQEGLGPTGNAFELIAEMTDLEIEPFRQNLALTEERYKVHPDDEELRTLRIRLRKEINTRELDLHRRKAERFPTEMSHRYEVGVRLLRAGQIDEAIQELQAARGDPRLRWQSLIQLGYCFKARTNWRLAQRNFEEALRLLPVQEAERKKEVLFVLAQGCADTGDLGRAIDLGNELANIDFSYREIGRLLDEWQTRLESADAPKK